MVSPPSVAASAGRKPPTPARSAAAMSGAASSTMPRLVLQPTAACVAATASRIRSPTGLPVAASGAPEASALASNCATVMPCPSLATCTLPGLSARSSRRQASTYACCKRSARSGEAGEDMLSERCGEVAGCHDLQALPRGHRVDFEHQQLAVAILDQVDAGIVGADRGGGGDALRGQLAGGGDPLATGAAPHIGDPAPAVAQHGGDWRAAHHHDAKVAPARRAADEALQVMHAGILLCRRRRFIRAKAHEAASLRAEQRL